VNKPSTLQTDILPENINKAIQFELFGKIAENYDRRDFQEVDRMITDMYEAGCRPVLAVRATEAEKYMREGYKAKGSWIKEAGKIIVGTFGRAPYQGGEPRAFFRLNLPRERIRARYTGPNHDFNGVVYIAGESIRPEDLEPIAYQEGHEMTLIRQARSQVINLLSA